MSPAAANSLRSPPLDRYQEQSFQQLCLLWRIRDQFWPDIDEPAARQAFTLAWAEYGEAILAQHNVYPGDYIMARAKVWIAGVDSPQFLKKLEVWLGAPDAKGTDERDIPKLFTYPTAGPGTHAAVIRGIPSFSA